MLDLLAASYHNIGPLYDTPLSLCFHKGTYLINAPVGTGKSFLFFDGPIFSLYKHTARPIRNRRSDNAYTQLLFLLDGQVRLIKRVITPTKKGGDSVKSMLYSLDIDIDTVGGILMPYDTLTDMVLDELFASHLEEVSFANEKELDASLQDLLPPKEVVLSSHFLMQDADNIFELAPAERLEIFKHIFGFIGIDHAKDILRDKRKEVQTAITIKGDATDLQQASVLLLQDIYTTLQHIQAVDIKDDYIQQTLGRWLTHSFFTDLPLIVEHVQLEGLTCDVSVDTLTDIIAYLTKKEQEVMKWNTLLEEGKKQQHLKQSRIQTLQQQIVSLEQEYASLMSTVGDTGEEKAYSILQERIENVKHTLVGIANPHIERTKQLGYEVEDIIGVVRVLDGIIAEGKQLQIQMETTKKTVERLQQDVIKQESMIEKIQQQQDAVDASYQEQTIFRCDKIQGDCPYVELIKGGSLRALAEQKERLVEQMSSYITEKKEIQQRLQEEKKQQDILDKRIDEGRKTVQRFQWKQLQEDYKIYTDMQKEYAHLLEQVEAYQKKQDKISTQKKRLQEIQTSKGMLEEQYIAVQQDIAASEKVLQGYTDTLSKSSAATLSALIIDLQHISQTLQELQKTLVQYAARRTEVALLEEEQLRLKHLHTIFSKELLIVVLQEFLPTIESTINSYLAEIAEYTLSFELEKTMSDTITLEIYVEDNKGKRVVKSLSGGQKSLLKLARIFSIATMLQLPFLFLDETITSLDTITTSHVADVLHRFVQQFSTKLYIITHAPQIQDMHIRDKEIQLQL